MADDVNPNPDVTPAVDPAVAAQSISIADLKTAGLPETYFGQDGKLNTKDLTTHLGEFASLKAANDERAKGVPTDGKYDFALPKDWKAPEGLDATGFEWGMSDGRKAAIADIAKSLNLSQSEVTAAMAKLAAADLGEKISTSKASQESAKAAEDAIKADAVKVLGANYTEVCANLRQAMVPIFGQELATNIGFQKAADVKAMLEFVESYKTKLAANPTPAGGQPGDPLNKLYPTMNPAR